MSQSTATPEKYELPMFEVSLMTTTTPNIIINILCEAYPNDCETLKIRGNDNAVLTVSNLEENPITQLVEFFKKAHVSPINNTITLINKEQSAQLEIEIGNDGAGSIEVKNSHNRLGLAEALWDDLEIKESPQFVMGAIMGSLAE